MSAFHTIAVPHKDILSGRLAMDVFAADLWEVYQNRGPDEYKDPDLFFEKTYETKGLKRLFAAVEKRLGGGGGDAVIQLQTPFGGGKTHALIGLYHKTKRSGANTFVFVGDKLSPIDVVIWEEMEKQLTGKVEELKGRIVPSGDRIRNVLEKKQPVALLVDELIEYLIPARGMKIEDTNFSSQVLSFIKRLTEVVSTLPNAILIATSPSRMQYSQEDLNLLNLLNERLGRLEKSLKPVEDSEVTRVVRKRLFSSVNEAVANNTVKSVAKYFKDENILPPGTEFSEYKSDFLQSYPFLPDVIDCFYQRWGSFPTFQRTRGILRLLSLIIYDLRESSKDYISLADINLVNSELRGELIKHIGTEFDSVISADLTGLKSCAKQVDSSYSTTGYQGLQLGSRSATTVFMCSFSGGRDIGATLNEVKRSVASVNHPSSIVTEAMEKLKTTLWYIRETNGKYNFSSRPNLIRIKLTKMENIEGTETVEIHKKELEAGVKKGKLKVFVWPKQSSDVPDTTDLKLVVLSKEDKSLMRNIIELKGTVPRINKNTIFFLTPKVEVIQELIAAIKGSKALELMEKDTSLDLTESEKKEIKKMKKEEEVSITTKIVEAYRILDLPRKRTEEESEQEENGGYTGIVGFDKDDLGIPTLGSGMTLNEEVFDRLKSGGVIISSMVPIVLKAKYLKGKDQVSTKLLLENSFKTLGEQRLLSKAVLENCIREGVKLGLFGLGELVDDKMNLLYWKQNPSTGFVDNEILIEQSTCEKILEERTKAAESITTPVTEGVIGETPGEITAAIAGEDSTGTPVKPIEQLADILTVLDLKSFTIPKGQVSTISRVLNYIQTKFSSIEIKIKASDGSISKEEFEDNIKEAFTQLGIKID
ncbi:MAG: DUF499 domain-containing protein [Candidatus Odinarchaeota archaeon]